MGLLSNFRTIMAYRRGVKEQRKLLASMTPAEQAKYWAKYREFEKNLNTYSQAEIDEMYARAERGEYVDWGKVVMEGKSNGR